MRASELYAASQGQKCTGRERCHWCLAPCDLHNKHDDVLFRPFVKSAQLPMNPAGHFVCQGCWLWRRKNLGINYLGNGYADRQECKNHSWLITERWAKVIRREDSERLYQFLLRPQLKFCLALRTEGIPNLIHLAVANDMPVIKADTVLHFSLNNQKMRYSVYELEEAIKHGAEGKEPGVRLLIEMFGTTDLVKPTEEEIKKKGRPVNSERQQHEEWKKARRQVR